MKTCSFFGHREIEKTERLEFLLRFAITNLVVNENVETFLFGSKSEFNTLCHGIVTELKEKFPNIKRVCYTCKSEACTLESEREANEKIYSNLLNREIHLLGFEEEFEHRTKYVVGKASYIKRNQAMIDDSDFCLFYYNRDYVPNTKTNSGTKIAYKYAMKKEKKVVNLFICC